MKDFQSRDQSFPDSDHSEDQKNLDISPLALFDAAYMDRFELLSAYLDGEVTAEQRRQVQQWLDTDPQVQKWYRQLTKLQQTAKYFPIPVESQPAHQLSAQVFRKLDRRRNQRLYVVGGALVTAIAVGLVIHLFPGRYSTTHQMAQNLPSVGEAESEPLMIALNRPVLDMSSFDGELTKEK